MKGPVDTAERNYMNCVGSPNTPPSSGGGTASQEPDFSEYMWMAEELEEFDKKVEEELWEQMFLEDCISGLLEEEEVEEDEYWWVPPQVQHHPGPVVDGLNQQMSALNLNTWSPQLNQPVQSPTPSAAVVANSSLNPNAPEFVPRSQMTYYGQER